jgi:hypothetical protein
LLFVWGGGGFAEHQCSEVSPSVRLCPLVLPLMIGWWQGGRSGSDESKAMRGGPLSTQHRKEFYNL